MTFEQLHAQVEADPLHELRRRRQMWASAPPSRGVSLHSAIVPDETISAAINEIARLRAERRMWHRFVFWLAPLFSGRGREAA